MRFIIPALLLAACASAPKPAPVVSDPSAEPMVRVSPENFEMCVLGQTLPYRAQVELRLTAGPNGFVETADVVETSDPCLNESVLTAVRKWRYPPKMIDGELAARKDIRAIIRVVAEDYPQ